jgi:hypothetical protein
VCQPQRVKRPAREQRCADTLELGTYRGKGGDGGIRLDVVTVSVVISIVISVIGSIGSLVSASY